jgi:hypothetical protein
LSFVNRAKCDASPTIWKGPNFTFSRMTGNTTLRGHLESIHETEYLELCAAKGWRMQLPKRSKAITLEGSSQAGVQGGQDRPRPKFFQATFLRHLINFIVADDQVRHISLGSLTVWSHRFHFSQSEWLNVVNSVTSFSCYEKTCRIVLSPTGQKFVNLLFRHGDRGLRF